MPGIFDANSPEPSRRVDLDDLLHRDAQADLERWLDETEEWLAADDERLAREGCPPEVAEALASVTGADDAPLTFRSLHDRVVRGTLTWDQFWQAPHHEADGMRVVAAVMRRADADIVATVADESEVEPDVRRARAEQVRAEVEAARREEGEDRR